MSLVPHKRRVHMNGAQYLELMRAKIEQRRVDIIVMYTPVSAYILRVRVH